MRKILFSDRYGLTKAVLEGRKTMTRRIVPDGTPLGNWEETIKKSRYQIGEVVAVAQCYKDAGYDAMLLQTAFVKDPTIFPEIDPYEPVMGWCDLPMKCHKGWNNKMFIYPTMMPHQIRITNIRVERLQDISDEDCMREGIMEGEFMNTWDTFYYDEWGDVPNHITFKSPLNAFAALIDKVSGKGTWESNPYCFVYEFELIK